MTWQEFWVRLAIAAALTPVIKYVPMVFGVDVLWLAAVVVALLLVLLGEFAWELIFGD